MGFPCIGRRNPSFKDPEVLRILPLKSGGYASSFMDSLPLSVHWSYLNVSLAQRILRYISVFFLFSCLLFHFSFRWCLICLCSVFICPCLYRLRLTALSTSVRPLGSTFNFVYCARESLNWLGLGSRINLICCS